MKVLFICRANKIRSRGAEAWFREKFPMHEFKSCGTDKEWVQQTRRWVSDAQVMSNELIEWADKLVFMEGVNKKNAIQMFGKDVINSKIVEVWGLEDTFDSWDDAALTGCFEFWRLDNFFDWS